MTYADDYSLRDADNIDINNIADAIDGLLVSTHVAGTSGNSISLATTATWTDMTDLSVSVTVAAGESVCIDASVSFSHSESGPGSETNIRVMRDSTEVGYAQVGIGTGSTLGYSNVVTSHVRDDDPGAGTYTYKVQWQTAAATAYSYCRHMRCVKVQTGAA